MCRFSGHTQFYSVAEHCLSVAERLPSHLQLAGLLHDASEAYLGDIPSPIKAVLPDYRSLEIKSELAIFQKFDLQEALTDWDAIKKADLEALYTEAHYLLPSQGKDWSFFQKGTWHVQHQYKPLCLPPAVVYKAFINAFEMLTNTEKSLILV